MAQPTQERLASQLENPQGTSGNVGQAGSGTQSEHGPQYQDHDDEHTHQVGMKTYYLIFSFLIVMLFVTVGAWYVDQHLYSLGRFSTPVAMAIAVAKAVAIVLFFMHIKYSSRLVQTFSCMGIAFLAIMFLLTFNDFGTRPWLPNAGVYSVSSAQNSMGHNGNNNDQTGTIVRAPSIGAAPNSYSTPTDNRTMDARNAPGNAGQVAANGARDGVFTPRTAVNGGALPVAGAGTRGATTMSAAMRDPNSAVYDYGYSGTSSNRSTSGTGATSGVQQSGSTGATGMVGGGDNVSVGGSTQGDGPVVGGAANNVYGSSAQSKGIQAQPAGRFSPSEQAPTSSY